MTAPQILRIAIVEDDILIRQLLMSALSGVHEVQAAADAKTGWELFQHHTPHIAFIDIGLPDGNGHDLAQRIKKENPETYIVMITVSRDIQNKISAATNHVDGFISKPFTKPQVMEYIARYIADHHSTKD